MDREISNLVTKDQFIRREFSEPHNRYQDEVLLLNAVRDGDVTLARELLAQPVQGTPGRLSEDPLRNQKNLHIARIATICRAAIEGGLSNEESYTLSDAYILRGERCHSVEEVQKLSNRAVLDYAGAVASVRSRDASPVIEKAMDYISGHLHYPITLETVAREVKISPYYLSRIFHQETGETLTTYIQKERIKAAQNMLRFSDYSYLEIATYLNFKSQSYFGSVFKKYTGMTPGQYRRSL